MAIRTHGHYTAPRRRTVSPAADFGVSLAVISAMLILVTVILLLVTANPSPEVAGPRGGTVIDRNAETGGDGIYRDFGGYAPAPTPVPVGVAPAPVP